MTVTSSALRLLTSPLTSLSGSSTASPSSSPPTSSNTSPHRTPELTRRTSWGSVSSSSSPDTEDTELREWNYRSRSNRVGEQDEVERKRFEGRRMRDRMAERTWREFWG